MLSSLEKQTFLLPRSFSLPLHERLEQQDEEGEEKWQDKTEIDGVDERREAVRVSVVKFVV